MTDDTGDLVIGTIEVLRGLAVCMIESGVATHQSIINLMNTIIDVQKDRDGGNSPARHIPAEVVRETVEALLGREGDQTPSRPSLRVILGGVIDQVEEREGS